MAAATQGVRELFEEGTRAMVCGPYVSLDPVAMLFLCRPLSAAQHGYNLEGARSAYRSALALEPAGALGLNRSELPWLPAPKCPVAIA